MATIEKIPEEIIEMILSDENITIQDLVNFSSSCTRFYDMARNVNGMWRLHFYKRWPRLVNRCVEELRKGEVDFEEFVQARVECRKELRDYLLGMNRKFYDGSEYEVEVHSGDDIYIDEKDLDFLIHRINKGHRMNCCFLMDELTILLRKSDSGPKDELTNIYYGEMLLRRLKHYYLEGMWQEFICRPAKQQLLEELLTLVAQWFRPNRDISYSQIVTELDNIAQQVMKRLELECPRHPIFSASRQRFSYWKCNNIEENEWNKDDGKRILDTLSKVLVELKFRVECNGVKISLQEYHFINQVLERKVGCILLLKIIFQSVARRLGIRCDLIPHSDRCLLIWKPNYKETNFDHSCLFIDFGQRSDEVILIDGHHSGTNCAKRFMYNGDICDGITAEELILKLTDCLEMAGTSDDNLQKRMYERWLCEFERLAREDDVFMIERLYKHYSFQSRSMSVFVPTLEVIIENEECGEMRREAKSLLRKVKRYEKRLFRRLEIENKYICKPKLKIASMKYTVGMMVTITSEEQLAGVIIGREQSELEPSNVVEACTGLRDPIIQWYSVLCEDEKLHYQSEDSLELMDTRRPISNSRIGKYFSEFKGTHYVPNEMLANEYPDDASYLSNEM